MATMTIHDIDAALIARLEIRAAAHGMSMEDEAREILHDALSVDIGAARNLAEAIRARIEPLGGVELPEISREAMRTPTALNT